MVFVLSSLIPNATRHEVSELRNLGEGMAELIHEELWYVCQRKPGDYAASLLRRSHRI